MTTQQIGQRRNWRKIKGFKDATIEQAEGENLFRVSRIDLRHYQYFASRADALEAFVLGYIIHTEGEIFDALQAHDQKFELTDTDCIQSWLHWRDAQQEKLSRLQVENPACGIRVSFAR